MKEVIQNIIQGLVLLLLLSLILKILFASKTTIRKKGLLVDVASSSIAFFDKGEALS
ncbi:hypothetical protein HUE58_04230 [Candidatus Ruthia endofausta]|uniref:Uncharacterized protein n=1 Tax=Candidatus Ruthia endofausta TaxID=2738852 RepID=A0A6N0HPZ7_9GAMM|nr:hypothetical protein [Candidatus Ruthia endofausta]QKQ24341.1 hypothetical protein HUE58_04230 [Candidatus Ruthia endofausta]